MNCKWSWTFDINERYWRCCSSNKWPSYNILPSPHPPHPQELRELMLSWNLSTSCKHVKPHSTLVICDTSVTLDLYDSVPLFSVSLTIMFSCTGENACQPNSGRIGGKCMNLKNTLKTFHSHACHIGQCSYHQIYVATF